MLAREGTTRLDARPDNLFSRMENPFDLIRVSSIEEEIGMQIPVPRMEDVRDNQVVAPSDIFYKAHDLW